MAKSDACVGAAVGAAVIGWMLVSAPAVAGQAPQQTEPVSAQVDDSTNRVITVTGHVLKPRQVRPDARALRELDLPPGFEIELFADALVNPRMLAVADDGTVYVTRRSVGDVVMLKDDDGDGIAEVRQRVASRPQMHGIAIDGDIVYLTTVTDVFRAERRDDGTLGPLERIIDDLPEGGQHPNRTIAVGPDGKLYISVGSTCNACDETSPELATLIRAEPDGSYRSVFATGLRNTVGFAFEPETGELYGMDHGIDWLGDNEQHEELNHLREGHDYGWPYVYADGKLNPQDEPPAGITREDWAAQSTEPVGLYVPHAAPMQMVFYAGEQFPEEYRGDAFVAMRGSWNRRPPSGYELLRIRFENGEPTAFEAFLTGFLTGDGEGGWRYLARPAGVAQAPDGSLLMSDDTNGRIYRIRYTGDPDSSADAPASALEPTNAEGATVGMIAAQRQQQRDLPPSEELAIAALNLEQTLEVASPAFADGSTIPDAHAADGEDISPPLEWRAAPEGTSAYVVIVEDPDAPRPAPYVHWLAYNIPAEVADLREGIPGTAAVPLPRGMLQGRNDNGTTGWFGMKPPVGDAPHAYHFQVFALDSVLEVPHGANRETLLEAMRGRVLAAGETIGTYRRE